MVLTLNTGLELGQKISEVLKMTYVDSVKEKMKTGEYMATWNGYTPYYAGCLDGDNVALRGGEEQYKHCYGFYSEIGEPQLEWWIKEELDKLSSFEEEELVYFLAENESFDEYKKRITNPLAKVLNVEPYQIRNLPNKTLRNFIRLVREQSEDMEPYWFD